MIKTLTFPSVYEATIREYYTSNDPILGFSKIKFEGMDYLIGLQALNEGVSPNKYINASPAETDYKLIAQSALLLASDMCASIAKTAKMPKLCVTAGFPYATFQLNRDLAKEYLQTENMITYFVASEKGVATTEQKLIPITNVNVIPEVLGCDYAIRKGAHPVDGNYIVISLGYGTCEGALSTPQGLVSRTIFSTHGLNYAVDIFGQELVKNTNIGIKNEHQLDQIFVKGNTYSERKHKDLTKEKWTAIEIYFKNIIMPAIRRFITDGDVENASSVYLAGGGAYNEELVTLFKDEFGEACNVIVPENSERLASIGYALYSKINSNYDESKIGEDGFYITDKGGVAFVGIDIGNANTCVSVLE